MADIEHANLPDELLHEPKGASTATEGTVYVADGKGSGSFTNLPLTDLDFTKLTLQNTIHYNVTAKTAIEGTTSATTTGAVSAVPAQVSIPAEYTATINKDLQEVVTKLNELIASYNYLVENVKRNKADLVRVVNGLREVGLANEN